MQFTPTEGQQVCLKHSVTRASQHPKDLETLSTISSLLTDFASGAVKLSIPLNGTQYWKVDDLELID